MVVILPVDINWSGGPFQFNMYLYLGRFDADLEGATATCVLLILMLYFSSILIYLLANT